MVRTPVHRTRIKRTPVPRTPIPRDARYRPSPTLVRPESWFCINCGHNNSGVRKTCIDCGDPKVLTPEEQAPPGTRLTIWRAFKASYTQGRVHIYCPCGCKNLINASAVRDKEEETIVAVPGCMTQVTFKHKKNRWQYRRYKSRRKKRHAKFIVPSDVKVALKTARESGKLNMFNRKAVLATLKRSGCASEVEWIAEQGEKNYAMILKKSIGRRGVRKYG